MSSMSTNLYLNNIICPVFEARIFFFDDNIVYCSGLIAISCLFRFIISFYIKSFNCTFRLSL